ncbi:MAG TPA: hypothetical protein VK698_35505 [Kofleriaceae bacterium]|nr:hypothetical protein [Kofleriaceae bacterium]
MSAALDDDEIAAIRHAVEQAVLAGAGDLRDALEREPAAFLRLLAAAQIGAHQADELLHAAVAGARRAGQSWDAIGGVLGVTRQAAQQRFKTAPAEPAGPHRRVLTGVHLFNEARILDQEGRRGFHLVDFGALYLVVEASAQQWKHRRMLGGTPAREKRLRAEGWIPVGSWFPFQYFKRPLGVPAADSLP